MKSKHSQAGAAAVKAAIAELEAGKIVFTGEAAEYRKGTSLPSFDIRPPVLACALANHQGIVHESDRGLLKLVHYLDATALYERHPYSHVEWSGINDLANRFYS